MNLERKTTYFYGHYVARLIQPSGRAVIWFTDDCSRRPLLKFLCFMQSELPGHSLRMVRLSYCGWYRSSAAFQTH